MKYIKPQDSLDSFNCPHCNAIAKQDWYYSLFNMQSRSASNGSNPLKTARCHHCQKYSVWVNGMMYYPDSGLAPFPNDCMPDSVLKLYNEASIVSTKSPRGAAALLRLSIQVLCKELGESGTDINSDIGKLVKKGLPEIVQQSLDIVRVTGNDAVHPGQIDTDNQETVNNLFSLVNIIVEYMIALPKKVSGIYADLPANKLEGIRSRDEGNK